MSETTDPTQSGIHRAVKEIQAGGASDLAEKGIDLMNECTDAHGVFTALYGVLYAAGSAMACTGAVLDERVDMRQQLAPLFAGYDDQRASRSKKT